MTTMFLNDLETDLENVDLLFVFITRFCQETERYLTEPQTTDVYLIIMKWDLIKDRRRIRQAKNVHRTLFYSFWDSFYGLVTL
jgi:hypothetical protein